jgi:hypothetical protein
MKPPTTQNQEVLYHLIKNRSLTSIEIRQLTNISYPPARCANLQDYGISLITSRERYVTKKHKKVTSIARYTLATTIKEAKKIYNTLTD